MPRKFIFCGSYSKDSFNYLTLYDKEGTLKTFLISIPKGQKDTLHQ